MVEVTSTIVHNLLELLVDQKSDGDSLPQSALSEAIVSVDRAYESLNTIYVAFYGAVQRKLGVIDS